MHVSGLFVYPVKSLRGIALSRSAVEPRGLRWDRRWMIVDANGRFMTQRQTAAMARLATGLTDDRLTIAAEGATGSVSVGLDERRETVEVSVWKWTGPAARVSPLADAYLSEALGTDCRLVAMLDDAERIGWGEAPIAFPDGGAILVAGETSLDALNGHLEEPVPMDRFRANIVLQDAGPYAEDEWTGFRAGDLDFRFAKRCGRCLVTTTDQQTGERHPGEEPLRTLVRERLFDKAACFGSFYVPEGEGEIAVGDAIRL